MTRKWSVVVNRGIPIDLGTVIESTEELARCAALSQFGIAEDDEFVEVEEGLRGPRGILLEDDFSVFPVS